MRTFFTIYVHALMGAPDNLQILCQFHPACSAALRGALHESGAPILQTRSVAEGLQNKLLTGLNSIRCARCCSRPTDSAKFT